MSKMQPLVIAALGLTYFTFAILLNSVGTVILQVIQHYGVSKAEAGVLEGFKDLPIAIVSFLVASSLPRYGFRRAIVTGMAMVAVICAAMPFLPGFWMAKMMFLVAGIAFALVKISVYASIGLITGTPREHAGMLNTIEGVFMVGVLAGYWLFGAFIGTEGDGWLDVYWVLAGLCVLNILLWSVTPLDESQAKTTTRTTLKADFVHMLKLLALPMVYIFVISAFLYVLIEQGVGTWLPTFNREVLQLPADMSVQVTSIFAASLAIGRLSAGVIMRKWHWYPVLNVCLLAMALLIILTLPLAENITHTENINWFNAPMAAYLFPLIGLCMAPIYPVINSVVLSALEKPKHASMTGLIVIFSALGGTTGSLITGLVFEYFDGQTAFYTALIPIVGIAVTLYFFHRHTREH